jgi:large subunit ribosomal protein L1
MQKRSKRYNNDAKKAVREPQSLPQAVKKLKSFASTKFDQSVDIVMHLGIDPKMADQGIRGAISLPNGIGKARRVIAFCEDSESEAAKKAGAIEAGADELIKKVSDGWTDFDVAIASPKIMGRPASAVRCWDLRAKCLLPKTAQSPRMLLPPSRSLRLVRSNSAMMPAVMCMLWLAS